MKTTDDLTGKFIVITGATSGIGLAAAQTLARHGAGVIGIGRSVPRCQEAEEQVRAAAPEARVRYLLANFSRLAEVRAVVPQIRETLAEWGRPALDVLVNNAGAISPTYVRTEDGLELTAAVTHFAHFLLTQALLPELKAAPQARVITVSSNSHRGIPLFKSWLIRPPIYFFHLAYKTAKLCNVLFTCEFNRRFAGTRLRAFAFDPGLVNTAIGQKTPSKLVGLGWGYRRQGGADPQIPADGILYLAAAPELQETCEPYWLRNRLPKTPSRYALDEKAAADLWDLSLKVCGIPQ